MIAIKTTPLEIKIALIMEECLELSSKGSNTFIFDLGLLIKVNTPLKKGVSFAPIKKQDNPHHPAIVKIIALHIVFVRNINYLLMGLLVSV